VAELTVAVADAEAVVAVAIAVAIAVVAAAVATAAVSTEAMAMGAAVLRVAERPLAEAALLSVVAAAPTVPIVRVCMLFMMVRLSRS
jgi:hypothetical protein